MGLRLKGPPPPPTTIPAVSEWTLIEEWDVGDLTFIEGNTGGFDGASCGDTLAWSPDGTYITLSSSANDQDIIRSFECSVQFDPSTAFALVGSQSQVNPGNGVFNGDGTAFYCLHTVGDEISQFAATDFVIAGTGELSDITKSNLGFNADNDGSFIINPAGNILWWMGRNNSTGNHWVTVNIPDGDLDSFTTLADVAGFSVDRNGLAMTIAENLIVQTRGSPGIRFLTFDNLETLDNAAVGSNQSLAGLTQIDMRPSRVWFNPQNTSEIWFSDEDTGGVKISRFATNVE